MNTTYHIDPIDGATVTVDTVHEKVHAGRLFTFNNIMSVNAGQVIKILVRSPVGCYAHMETVSMTTTVAPLVSRCYEGTTVSATGSLIPVVNNNRNSVNTPNLQLFLEPTVTTN